MKSLTDRFKDNELMFMEGALGERLKREYGLDISGVAAMAPLVYRKEGRNALASLWRQYLAIATRYELPFLATTPTRRANKDNIFQSGHSGDIISDNVRFLKSVLSGSKVPTYAGGLMGCKGDAYTGEGCLNEGEAYRFHCWQAKLFKEAKADFIMAGIMPTLPEATGMAQALSETNLPYIISFTIRPDGCLIDSTPIATAIEHIEKSVDNRPLCYMTNCIHPSFVAQALEQPFNNVPLVRSRFKGLQANTAALVYDEIDGADILKSTSTPVSLATDIKYLRERFGLSVFGGCCGTDSEYMVEMAKALVFHHQLQ